MKVTLALANNDAMLAVRFLLELVSLACVTLWASSKWGKTDPLAGGELVIQMAVPVNRRGA